MALLAVLISGIFITIGAIALDRQGYGLEAWRDYRAGKAVDKSAAWAIVKATFPTVGVKK